jgi:hypothetical protein
MADVLVAELAEASTAMATDEEHESAPAGDSTPGSGG